MEEKMKDTHGDGLESRGLLHRIIMTFSAWNMEIAEQMANSLTTSSKFCFVLWASIVEISIC